MRVGDQIRHCVTFGLALAFAFLGSASDKPFNSNLGATVEAQTPQAPLIPAAGPLASSKSLKQVGVLIEATRAAVPADNPQTQEKVALGEKLFFEDVCRSKPKPSRSCVAVQPEATLKSWLDISFRPTLGSEENRN